MICMHLPMSTICALPPVFSCQLPLCQRNRTVPGQTASGQTFISSPARMAGWQLRSHPRPTCLSGSDRRRDERRQADQTPIPARIPPEPWAPRQRTDVGGEHAARRWPGMAGRQCRNAMRRPDALGPVRPRHRPARTRLERVSVCPS
jgi:hypothetical protein